MPSATAGGIFLPQTFSNGFISNIKFLQLPVTIRRKLFERCQRRLVL